MQRVNTRALAELFPDEERRVLARYDEDFYRLQAESARNREVMEARRKIENGVEE